MKKSIMLGMVLLSTCFTSIVYSFSCIELSSLAETVMSARQRNVDITNLITEFNTDSAVDKLVRILIEDAYSKPLYSTDGYKANEVRSFKNDVYLSCAG